jgi:hypothetical protein
VLRRAERSRDRFVVLVLVLVSLWGWGLVPALAQADFRRGDTNVDGKVDLADASFLLRWAFYDGATPTCRDAADINDDSLSGDIADAVGLVQWAFLGGVWSPPAPGPEVPGPDPTSDGCTCESYEPVSPPKIADFTLGFDCPNNPAAAPGQTITFQAYATLTTANNTGGQGAEGWSLSIGAENCLITSATTAGTAAARITDHPPGFAKSPLIRQTEIVSDGEAAVSAILLFYSGGYAALPADGTQRVLALTVDAVVPRDPFQKARLFFVDGKQGSGQPVPNIVSVLGTTQVPFLGECTITFSDCNVNGILDSTDIASGTSQDCTGNGVPDECEPDCNQNGIADSCDITTGSSADCNANGIPDSCDLARGTAPDCNANGIPDSCDIASGSSADCNANGIPDSCETIGGAHDCNGNGFPDSCDIASGTSADCNANGVPDSCELASGAAQDCNANGIPDECDGPDCNLNGVPDSCDIGSGLLTDEDSDGLPDECQACPVPEPVDCQPGGDPVFRLSFRGPCKLFGEPGETVRAKVACQIETLCFDWAEGGVVGWQFGVALEGASLLSATTDGTVGAPVDRGGLAEFLEYTRLIVPSENDGKQGAITMVGLTSSGFPAPRSHLDAKDSPQDILLLTLEAKIPENGECARYRLSYEQGLRPPGGDPWGVQIAHAMNVDAPVGDLDAQASDPLFEQFTLELCPLGGLQRPGDGNQDGTLDLSDAVWLLGHLFLGTAPRLPCEGGTASSPGPGERALMDVNGDGGIDLSDSVSILSFLFLGGRPPTLGNECVRIVGCPEKCQ